MKHLAKVGRRSNYVTNVEPFLSRIDSWLSGGATEKQIADALDVAYSSWNNYKKAHPELDELCRKPRVNLVLDLKGVQVKEALGYTYQEKKTYIKKEDGKEVKYTEITEKYARPNMNALYGALKRLDPEHVKYDHQAQSIELKREELDLKKELAKEKLW